MKYNTFSITYCDFAKKTVKNTEVMECMPEPDLFSEHLSNFKEIPQNGVFKNLSPEERLKHSDHLLSYLHQLSLEDINHFINQGVLDIKKTSEKLNLSFVS